MDVMGVASLASSMATQQVQQEISTAMLKKAMDSVSLQGENLQTIMGSIADLEPHLGQGMDISV